MQRSGNDTIKYYARPRTPYGKVTKTQENITHNRAKRSALSKLVTTKLQGTDKTVRQRQTRNTNDKKDPQKTHRLRTVRKKITEGDNKIIC